MSQRYQWTCLQRRHTDDHKAYEKMLGITNSWKWKWNWSCSLVSKSLWPRGLYVAYQAPLSLGFSRQEYWSGLLFPSSEDLSNPGIQHRSPALQADSLPSPPPGKLFILVNDQIFELKSKAQRIHFLPLFSWVSVPLSLLLMLKVLLSWRLLLIWRNKKMGF